MSATAQPTINTAYSPEDISVLGGAYDMVCDMARLHGASEVVRDLVASTIFDIGGMGERDELRLADLVMKSLGLRICYAS